jgi:hypothetical protein
MKLIRGISILHNKVVINSHFADDNTLFLDNSKEELNMILDILNLYCVVSGSLLSHNKIEYLMIQPGAAPNWIPNE